MDITYKNQKGVSNYIDCFEELWSCRYKMESKGFRIIDSNFFSKWYDEKEKLAKQLKTYNETYTVKPNVVVGQCFKGVYTSPYYKCIKYYRVEGIDENNKLINVTAIDRNYIEEGCLKFCYFNETKLIEIPSAEFERVIEARKMFD